MEMTAKHKTVYKDLPQVKRGLIQRTKPVIQFITKLSAKLGSSVSDIILWPEASTQDRWEDFDNMALHSNRNEIKYHNFLTKSSQLSLMMQPINCPALSYQNQRNQHCLWCCWRTVGANQSPPSSQRHSHHRRMTGGAWWRIRSTGGA